uniref:ATP synthase complex subunit 8 n=1 Tax=Allopsontus sp. 2 JZ-2014 TaxID=1529457 RepID=A0A0B4N508_9INSE|nr:ATP synthase subunit 8 [Allopsontus sp. 2 JZ-2014]
MPQMSPLMWLILFIFFSISYIMFMMFNFSNSSLNKIFNTHTNNIIKNPMNWKW